MNYDDRRLALFLAVVLFGTVAITILFDYLGGRT